MALQPGSVTIVNLRDGGQMKLQFPKEINTEDRANWEAADVASDLKPLSFANNDPQQITLEELVLDKTRTNASVEPEIETLRSWMRAKKGEGSPPELLVATVGWNQKCVLTDLSVRRTFFTPDGVCIRAYLQVVFGELKQSGRSIGNTGVQRGLSGRVLQQ
jgi:hypothetical protein